MEGNRISDPEEFAVLVVQQYLFENQHTAALAALEHACGKRFVESKLPSGSQLMQLVYSKMEADAADDPEENEDDGRLTEAEEEALMLAAPPDIPKAQVASLQGVFSTNVISVARWPGQEKMFVGTGDGVLHLYTFGGELLWQTAAVGKGGLLSLDFRGCRDPPLVVAGFMDGSVAVFSASSGALLCHQACHRKYCVRVRWLPGADTQDRFVTASWDNSVGIHELVGANASSPNSRAFNTLWAPEFAAAVQDVELAQLPAASSSSSTRSSDTLVVAVRASNYLRLLDLKRLQEDGRVNMNALGDDHVSFTATYLAVSPCGKFLLVSTDGPRIIMFGLKGWHQLRNFYGLPTEQFHQPAALWHHSGLYIMAAAAAGHIYVFHVGTAKVAASWKAHTKNTRALAYDSKQNVLLTGSFDKTVNVYGSAPARSDDA